MYKGVFVVEFILFFDTPGWSRIYYVVKEDLGGLLLLLLFWGKAENSFFCLFQSFVFGCNVMDSTD